MRTDLTNTEYHSHSAISSSDVKAVASKTLEHWRGQVRKEKAAFDMGTAVHAMLLQPDDDLITRGPIDRRGDKWKDLKLAADLDGKLLLTSGDYDIAQAMSESAMRNATARELLSHKDLICEASFFAIDPVTGIEIKCRPDGCTKSGLLLDVKTTRDASPDGFAREVHKFGYHIQAAFYTRVLRASGLPADQMHFIAVEKEPPYAVGVHILTKEYLYLADQVVTRTLEQISRAQSENRFTTGWPDVNVISLPRWLEEIPEDEEEDFN